MSSAQPVARETGFQLPQIATPVVQVASAVAVVPPAPPKDSLAKKAGEKLKAWGEGPRIVAAKICCNFVGAGAGYVVPAAALVAGARFIAQSNGASGGQVFFATAAGAVAALAQAGYQGSEGLGNIKLYKREGYSYPRLASFMDVAFCLVAPALAGAYFGGQYFGPWWGNALGCGAAIAMSSYALVHQDVRAKRTR